MIQDSNNTEPSVQISAELEKNKAQSDENSSVEPLMTTDGTPYQIPEEGSLGVLAIGYAGIMLWRDKIYNSSVKSENKTVKG